MHQFWCTLGSLNCLPIQSIYLLSHQKCSITIDSCFEQLDFDQGICIFLSFVDTKSSLSVFILYPLGLVHVNYAEVRFMHYTIRHYWSFYRNTDATSHKNLLLNIRYVTSQIILNENVLKMPVNTYGWKQINKCRFSEITNGILCTYT